MSTFYLIEIIQFSIGLILVVGDYFLISHYRKPLLDYTFRDSETAEKSFIGLTNIIYFLIFIPILIFGININPPVNYNVVTHIQYVIYYLGGILFVIGALHFFLMAISTKIKF